MKLNHLKQIKTQMDVHMTCPRPQCPSLTHTCGRRGLNIVCAKKTRTRGLTSQLSLHRLTSSHSLASQQKQLSCFVLKAKRGRWRYPRGLLSAEFFVVALFVTEKLVCVAHSLLYPYPTTVDTYTQWLRHQRPYPTARYLSYSNPEISPSSPSLSPLSSVSVSKIKSSIELTM